MICPFIFSIIFFAWKAHVTTEKLGRFLRLFRASFLSIAINTPNFTVTTGKKFRFHILAPLLHLKTLQKQWNFGVLDHVYIGLSETTNKRAFLTKIWDNLWSEKSANPSGHNTNHGKCNFRRRNIEHLWAARYSANEVWVHVNHIGSQCPTNTKTWYLQGTFKLHTNYNPSSIFFWCRWVDLANLYNRSLLNFSRKVRQIPSNSDWN